MTMTELALHEISEAGHRILNPISEAQLLAAGIISRAGNGTRVLDLACGKGELLSQWARQFGITGTGVDISATFLRAARERAVELGVDCQLDFIEADASSFQAERAGYDIGACIGATWIGGGPAGTIVKLRPAVRPGGLLLIGEPYWKSPPPDAAYAGIEVERDTFTDLAGLLDLFDSAGAELVEMILADGASWDRYVAAQWWTLRAWLDENPNDPRYPEVNEFLQRSRRSYLEFGRRYLGWGIFILRAGRP